MSIKDKVDIASWREKTRFERLRRQVEREDGQLLILSPNSGLAAALSALSSKSSSADKGTTSAPNIQEQKYNKTSIINYSLYNQL